MDACDYYINGVTFEALCRICASPADGLVSIFVEDGLELSLHAKIYDVLQIEVSVDDPLPHCICFKCNYQILAWHNLKETAVRSEEQLKQLLDFIEGESGHTPYDNSTKQGKVLAKERRENVTGESKLKPQSHRLKKKSVVTISDKVELDGHKNNVVKAMNQVSPINIRPQSEGIKKKAEEAASDKAVSCGLSIEPVETGHKIFATKMKAQTKLVMKKSEAITSEKLQSHKLNNKSKIALDEGSRSRRIKKEPKKYLDEVTSIESDSVKDSTKPKNEEEGDVSENAVRDLGQLRRNVLPMNTKIIAAEKMTKNQTDFTGSPNKKAETSPTCISQRVLDIVTMTAAVESNMQSPKRKRTYTTNDSKVVSESGAPMEECSSKTSTSKQNKSPTSRKSQRGLVIDVQEDGVEDTSNDSKPKRQSELARIKQESIRFGRRISRRVVRAVEYTSTPKRNLSLPANDLSPLLQVDIKTSDNENSLMGLSPPASPDAKTKELFAEVCSPISSSIMKFTRSPLTDASPITPSIAIEVNNESFSLNHSSTSKSLCVNNDSSISTDQSLRMVQKIEDRITEDFSIHFPIKLEELHLKLQGYSCNACPETFSRATDLRKHLLSHEISNTGNIKAPRKKPVRETVIYSYPRVCNECKRTYKSKQSYGKHKRVKVCAKHVGVRVPRRNITKSFPYSRMCDSCHAIYHSRQSYWNHLKNNTCNSTRRLPCFHPNCSIVIYHKRQMANHLKVHHGLSLD